jgi:amidase
MNTDTSKSGRPITPAGYQPPDLVMRDATALARAIRERQVSCREVMTAYLDHIEAVNPVVNAIVSLQDRNTLLAQSDTRDNELRRGVYHGWLHGIPQAIKDLAPTAGIRTTWGSPLFEDYVPGEDAIIVERMKRAGAIIIGKTNTTEFGLGSQTYNPVFGATRNAYDPTKTAGGSSGGAAAALAMRMLPVADGSDMMGSLRNPAAFNNGIGFRPSAVVCRMVQGAICLASSWVRKGPWAVQWPMWRHCLQPRPAMTRACRSLGNRTQRGLPAI